LRRIQGVPGLLLDVRPNGKRCWFVRYQPGGRNSRRFRWYKIGDAKVIGLHDATRHAGKVVKAVQEKNRDPHAERVAEVREGQTFDRLYWMPWQHLPAGGRYCLRTVGSGISANADNAARREPAANRQSEPSSFLILLAPGGRKTTDQRAARSARRCP
jgi:hypothetical protein